MRWGLGALNKTFTMCGLRGQCGLDNRRPNLHVGPIFNEYGLFVLLRPSVVFELRPPPSLSSEAEAPTAPTTSLLLVLCPATARGGAEVGDDRGGPPDRRFSFRSPIPSPPLPQAVKFNPHRRGSTEPWSLGSTATRLLDA